MAPEQQPCKVIIVGGSIAGLSLANMLERVGIDFVVLEAYKEIAPQVGASITIWPHFARILDQIGCWSNHGHLHVPISVKGIDKLTSFWKGDSLRALVDEYCNQAFYRNQQGESVFEFPGMGDILERRHGYPAIFIDRQMLVSALYQNLRHKDKVLVQKRLTQIEQMDDGVRAITQDGSTYIGDIIIGADGMHSCVREIMHIFGRSFSSPDYFGKDEYSKVPCTYKCIFGMSKPTKGIEKGTTHVVMGKNYSYGIGSGTGKIYWFLNVKNSETTYGRGVPRYTVEDEQRLAEQHFKDRLNEYDTFEDVYRNRIKSRLTPLHEYQWKRWYFGRIMTIGDASHKIHPISGNGGAAAIEDAATLVNELHGKFILQRKLGQASQHLSTEEFQEIFAKTQRAQEDRSKQLLKQSTKIQQGDAMESRFAPLAVKYILPHLTGEAFFSLLAPTTVEGRQIQSLPIPQRNRYVPYSDELPAKPKGSMHISTTCFTILYSLLFYLACRPSVRYTASANSMYVGSPGLNLTTGVGYRVPGGHESMDGDLPSAVFSIPLVLIWNIEAHRCGNLRSLGSWPITLLFVAALSAIGAQKVLPLYFLFAIYNSRRVTYALTSGRPVPLSVVKAVSGVTYAIYASLATMLCLPAYQQALKNQKSALSHLLPVGISILIQYLAASTFAEPRRKVAKAETEKEYLRPYLNQDYSTLVALYRILFVVASLAGVFIPSTLANQRLITATILTFCLQNAFEMRRLGYVTTRQALSTSLAILLGTTMIGPVPAYIGTWYWRENVIHRLSK